MIIGGFHPLSLCDFPGIPAAVLFLQGCNWRCRYCHNQDLLPMEPEGDPLDFEVIFDLLKERAGKIKGVVFTGGEPTLQKDLERYMAPVRRLGLRIKLDSNGSNPACMQQLLEKGLLDYIAMDIKAPFEKYELVTGRHVSQKTLEESIALIAASGVPHQFRTTWPPHLLTEADIEKIKSFLPPGSNFVVQEYRQQ